MAGLTAQVIRGGVTRINRFVFPSERATVADELEGTDADIVIAGHFGIPFIERVGRRFWFNPGAIGMPANDGTPDTWFGLIRSKTGNVALSTHRLAYDYRGAAAAMRRWRHANSYGDALLTGLWPSLDVLPEPEKVQAGREFASLRCRPLRCTTRSFLRPDGNNGAVAPCARSFAMRSNPHSQPVHPLRRGDRLDCDGHLNPPPSAAPGRCRDVLIAIALAAKVLVPHSRMGS